MMAFMAPTPWFEDPTVTLWHGEATKTLRHLPANSVNCVVTSPPYFGLRDYGHPNQIGLEPTPQAYTKKLVEVFHETRRVLTEDGVLWVNLGDSYAGTGNSKTIGVAPKNLLGIPWRVAFGLQHDGWVLRNDIIWVKPNAMPESVTDRFTNRHEHLFMFTKSPKYWFDLDPVREPISSTPQALSWDRTTKEAIRPNNKSLQHRTSRLSVTQPPAKGRNPGDVWQIPTQPFPGAHFAVMPPKLVEQCVQASCKPSGTVLDPFHGSGTTGMVATRLGHKYVGIDVNEQYLKLSLETRLAQGTIT